MSTFPISLKKNEQTMKDTTADATRYRGPLHTLPNAAVIANAAAGG